MENPTGESTDGVLSSISTAKALNIHLSLGVES
jgi:hypothetical protein